MIYILCGADGSGKTHLANQLMELKKCDYIHASYKKEWLIDYYHNMIFETALQLVMYNKDIVLDRLHWCEYAYGTVHRDGPSYDVVKFNNEMYYRATELNGHKIVTIYCKPTESRFDPTARDEMFTHINGINEAYETIFELVNWKDILTYDWQTESFESLMERVKLIEDRK